MAALLEIEALQVSYHRGTSAVQGVDLVVEAGRAAAVLGANGAGKSSIMRAIAGWHPAIQGTIRFAGAEITRLPADERARRGLAFVPEGGHIFQRMTVRENLLMGGYLAEHPETRIAEACKPFPVLLDRLGQLAGTLSGGERQMLALARAAMSRPKLLLVDEVSMGLMPQAVAAVLHALRRLANEGISVLLSEQNARKALEVVDYAYLLGNGRIVLHGRPEDIAQDQRVIAAYLGG